MDQLLDDYLGEHELRTVLYPEQDQLTRGRVSFVDSLRNSFELVESEVTAHLDRFEVSPFPVQGISTLRNPDTLLRKAVEGEAQFETMLSLLHSIGSAIKRWQQPINLFWPHVPSSLSSIPLPFGPDDFGFVSVQVDPSRCIAKRSSLPSTTSFLHASPPPSLLSFEYS